ncbi:hypothetical protein PVAND_015402 [Polypedilum vanderplanki]|uniref:Zinc finger protein n=1 Tax=Polypedilum vanderplanki TaxID=319348 RepID=A0A9J6BCY2_POLVA|nr:hypothetical protein PVAND_015402 [Polypedilum vanderplanki]
MNEISEICRLCLEQNAEEMHQIFDECLNNKIVIITGLDLLPTDSLPKKICKNCRYQLEKSYFFRILAKQSDIKLRKFVRLTNQNKDASHILTKDYKDDDIEEYDEHMLDSYNYFDDIKHQIEEEKRKLIHEELLKLKSKFESPIKSDKSSQRTSSITTRRPTSDKPIVLLNKIPVSPSKTSPTLRRKRKLEEEKKEKVPIEISELQVVNDNDEYEIRILEANIDEEGQVEAVEVIEIEKAAEPEYEIISQEDIVELKKSPPKKKAAKKIEIQKVEKLQPQETATEYYFKNIGDDVEPELDENGEKKIFQCAFKDCKVAFSRRQQCKAHYYNHLAVDSQFACQYCSKRFKVQSALERHERVHSNSKPFICETCKKGFSQKEMLKRHLMIHLPIEEAQFACKICDKRFRQKDPLRQHMLKVHTDQDVPKFQCNLCEKSFAHSSGLSRHLLLHSGKIFSCEICNRQFTDKSALKRHGSIHEK